MLLIIPAFNEEANIARVVGSLERDYPHLDYVVVNDGSTDATAAICAEHGFNILNLPVNLGLAGAFQAGMKYAWRRGYRYAVQFDGDGQHRAEFVGDMREKMDEGCDLVIASRYVLQKKPFSLRMMGSRLIGGAIFLTTGVRIHDPTSGMRMFGRKLIGEFAFRLNYGPEPDTLAYLIRHGARVAEVPAEMDERTAGASYLTPFRAMGYMARILMSILVVQAFRGKG
ncbi:MAG: glycosyltransferase family 2 protein [Lachnospiraceae bacterium]|nr:glycosyltransferase family 2 protein [Lachnospiraceae bacterium]